MSANAYEVLALAMRYVFAALMLLIVIRAWRNTAVDSGRARKLRRLSPDTGIIGEMLVVDGGERAKPGMRYPVTLEGAIGSGRRADIRVRHSSVRPRHAFYQMTDEGLFVRGHANARLRDGAGRWVREMMLCDGDILRLGQVKLLLVLAGGGDAPEELNRRLRPRRVERERPEGAEETDDFFEPQADADMDELFMSNPASSFAPEEYDDGEFDRYEFAGDEFDEDEF